MGLIFYKTKSLYSYTSMYTYDTSNIKKKYLALPSIRYDSKDGGFHKRELWRLQEKSPLGSPAEKNDLSNFLCDI